jgi:hypothetical protein
MKKFIGVCLFILTLQAGCQEPDHNFTIPISVVKINFPDGTSIESASGIGFDGNYSSLMGVPTTFTPSLHSHFYNDLIDKPGEIELTEALQQLRIPVIPCLTTIQINALTPILGLLVCDTTLGVLKMGTGKTWKILATTN